MKLDKEYNLVLEMENKIMDEGVEYYIAEHGGVYSISCLSREGLAPEYLSYGPSFSSLSKAREYLKGQFKVVEKYDEDDNLIK